MSKIDLEQVNQNPMKNEKHGSTYRFLLKRVMINFIKEACGRGGEVKFHNYSEWNCLSVCLSVCWSGLHAPIAYSLLGGGVPILEQQLCGTLDSVPFKFKAYYVLYPP